MWLPWMQPSKATKPKATRRQRRLGQWQTSQADPKTKTSHATQTQKLLLNSAAKPTCPTTGSTPEIRVDQSRVCRSTTERSDAQCEQRTNQGLKASRPEPISVLNAAAPMYPISHYTHINCAKLSQHSCIILTPTPHQLHRHVTCKHVYQIATKWPQKPDTCLP